MRHNTSVVFVEVKQRTNNLQGGAIQSLSVSKQRKLVMTASMFLQTHPHSGPIRFDFIAFDGDKPIWITDVIQGDNLCLTI